MNEVSSYLNNGHDEGRSSNVMEESATDLLRRARSLAYITGAVNQELPLRNECLVLPCDPRSDGRRWRALPV
jgi:hypothetical protein